MCLLEMSGKSYEGKSVQMEEWGELKPKTPAGQLPYADMPDGSVICESGAIGRTIAGAAGFLGSGKNYTRSEMLMGIAADLHKEYMAISPTIFTVKDFNYAKKRAFEEGKPKVMEYCAKLEKNLLPNGDRFTDSGLTFGEVHVFCLLYCYSNGTMPEVVQGGLKKFYDRMMAVPGIKRVIDGESKFGQLGTYLIPVP
jgi:glutathione S-transferase